MDIKEICGKMGVSVVKFYDSMHTTSAKLSYYNKQNKQRYHDTITAGIINFYSIDHAELLTILDLYKMQHKK